MRGVVSAGDASGAAVRDRDRAHLDLDLALEGRVVDDLGQLGPGHAADDLVDVQQICEHSLRRRGDRERIFQLHFNCKSSRIVEFTYGSVCEAKALDGAVPRSDGATR